MGFGRRLARRNRDPNTMQCDTHGSVVWQSDVICDGCGRLHNLDDPACPRICPCGKKLKADGADDDFSARIVCPSCAKALRAQQQPGCGPS